jgi:hypothetical protein
MPFVQGHLRKEDLSFKISTECGHCGKPLNLQIDSHLNFQVEEAEASPLVYAPMVDFDKIGDPSIIDAF